MALQIWLPLNGDNWNHGTYPVASYRKLTNASTFASDTMVGKSLALSSTTIQFNTNINTANGVTIACWFKAATSTTAWSDVFSLNSYNVRLEINTSSTYYLYNDSLPSDGGNLAPSGTNVATLSKDTWHHFAFCSTGTTTTIYIDGVPNASTYTAIPFTISTVTLGARYAGNMPIAGNLFDFRIYDECLSKSAIDELAACKVLHYPLTSISNMYGAKNLVPYNPLTTSNVVSDGIYVNIGSNLDLYSTFWICTPNTTGNKRFYLSTENVWKSGKTYTVSFIAKSETATVIQCSRSLVDKSSSVTLSPTWTKYSVKINCTATATGGTLSIAYISGDVFYIRSIKLEQDTHETPFVPSTGDPRYTAVKRASANIASLIRDVSPFSVDGTTTAEVNHEVVYDGIRGNHIKLVAGESAFTITPPHWNPGTKISRLAVMLWFKVTNVTVNHVLVGAYTTYGSSYGPVQIELNSDGTLLTISHGANSSNITNKFISAAYSISSKHLGDGNWHHIADIFDGGTEKLYIDGELWTSSSCQITEIYSWHNNMGIGGMAYGQSAGGFELSDVRFYCGQVTAEMVKRHANRGAAVQCNGTFDTYGQLVSTDSHPQIHHGSISVHEISELSCRFDSHIYSEPDMTMWIRVAHQANPASTANLFASTDAFSTYVYKNENAWFDVAAFANSSFSWWELMIKQKGTATGTEDIYRWQQEYNPMIATYDQTGSSNVYRYPSGSRYTMHESYYGLHKHGTNTYLCANNGNSGHWWGAIGAWAQHNSGIPGWGATLVTTGYIDLYIRVNCVGMTGAKQAKCQINSNEHILTPHFVEL